MANLRNQLDELKYNLTNIFSPDKGSHSRWAIRMLPAFLLAAIIGFALTWIYVDMSSRQNEVNTIATHSSPEQVQQTVEASKASAESVLDDDGASTRNYLPGIKKEVNKTSSDAAWSADSFLDVMQDPASNSDLTSAVDSAAKQTNRAPSNPYVDSLIGEAENLSVLPIDAKTERIGASDQAAFDRQSPQSQPTSIQYTPDGLLVVQRGDSLSMIAQKLYGNEMAYNRIFTENLDILNDPNVLAVGQQLRIPDVGAVNQ